MTHPLYKIGKAVEGCGHCEYDEAEGGIVNHCDACCRRITTELCSLAWGDINAKQGLKRIAALESVLRAIQPASHSENAWFATIDRIIALEAESARLTTEITLHQDDVTSYQHQARQQEQRADKAERERDEARFLAEKLNAEAAFDGYDPEHLPWRGIDKSNEDDT